MKKIQKLEAHLQRDFKSNYVIYWNNLSRLTNMLIISNFSLFFLTELVTRDRYYYTHLSLVGFSDTWRPAYSKIFDVSFCVSERL
ncbi:MAG: hypothetical protein WBM69_00525 [Desulfobacterales bacterium]